MFEKCDELDEKIEHYTKLSKQIADRPILENLAKLVVELTAQKLDLHPQADDV